MKPISMVTTVVWRVSMVTLTTEDILNVILITGLKYAMNITMGKTAKRNVYRRTTAQDITFVTTMGIKYVLTVFVNKSKQ